MPIDINDLTIKQIRGHFEVYVNGKFFCTADNYLEAIREAYYCYNG